MSFGQAASRGRGVASAAPCPCGSGESFAACCGPVLRGEPAPTAARLMRSRYTAFFVGDADHLSRSWHPRTRPGAIEIDDEVRWTGLKILKVEAGGPDDADGVVEFSASWSDGTGSGLLHERSRFVRQRGRWWYLDGEVR